MDRRRTIPVAAVVLLAAAGTMANTGVFRCEGEHGEPVFSNLHCGGGAIPVELGRDRVMAGSASLREARDQLQRVQRLPAPERDVRPRRGGGRPGFGERMELRRLEIRADGLRRDLMTPRGRQAREELERELRAVTERIRQLKTGQTQ